MKRLLSAVCIVAIGLTAPGRPSAATTVQGSVAFTHALRGAALATPEARFAIAFPLRNQAELQKLLADLQDPASPRYHRWLTPAQFASSFGPALAARTAIARELSANGFAVRVTSQEVFGHGPQAAAERYFRTKFALRSPDGVSRPVYTPLAPLQRSPLLVSQNARVIGLDGFGDLRTQSHVGSERTLFPQNYNGPQGPYFATDLKQAYSYPSYAVATGAGASIGILSASPVNPSDYETYFDAIGEYAPGNAYPTVFNIPIDGGGPFNASSAATVEATLDVEMSAGSAPGAQIAVFDEPTLSFADFLESYSIAVESGVNIVSSSLGACELDFNSQTGGWYEAALHSVFEEGSTEGISFVGASGDNGAFNCGTTTTTSSLGVISPVNDPLVIGVGGTTALTTSYTSGSYVSKYVSETSYDTPFTDHGGAVWGSGGGYSVLYARPAYQTGFNTKSAFRGLPDLAMHMGGPANGQSTDWIVLGGQYYQDYGTSAAAPEFAGLLALRIQLSGSLQGDLHPALYAAAKKTGAFRKGIHGNNGYYATTTTMWDPVLGLGTPYGRVIAGVPTAPLAGTPETPTNP
jgi:subtilase family serine protease